MTRKNDKTFKNEEVYDYFEGEKESSPEQESEPKDILDDLRKIDKKEKMKQLKELMNYLKVLQKKINMTKYECKEAIKQLGFDDKDVKRIIDFIGEMPDVKLNRKDKKKIEEKIQDKLNGETEKSEEENLNTYSFSSPPEGSFPDNYSNLVYKYNWEANPWTVYSNSDDITMHTCENSSVLTDCTTGKKLEM